MFVSQTPWIQRAFDKGEITLQQAIDYDRDEEVEARRDAYEYEMQCLYGDYDDGFQEELYD